MNHDEECAKIVSHAIDAAIDAKKMTILEVTPQRLAGCRKWLEYMCDRHEKNEFWQLDDWRILLQVGTIPA